MRGIKLTIIVDTHRIDPIARDGKSGSSHMDVMEGFQPTRWMNPETRHRQEFIPFGAGPQYCLGVDFALVEMKNFLAVLAQQIPQFDLVYLHINANSLRLHGVKKLSFQCQKRELSFELVKNLENNIWFCAHYDT
jgi:hypothetical protein